MGAKAEWRVFAAVGTVLVAITFTNWSPEGPWNDSTFTSGSLGLTGMMLLYLAWFRLTFESKGVVPTMDMWKDPEGTSPGAGGGMCGTPVPQRPRALGG